jgi:hypothetical protein
MRIKFLTEVANPDIFRQLYASGIRADLTPDQRKNSTFPGAVRTDYAHAFAVIDPEAGILKHFMCSKTFADIYEINHLYSLPSHGLSD